MLTKVAGDDILNKIDNGGYMKFMTALLLCMLIYPSGFTVHEDINLLKEQIHQSAEEVEVQKIVNISKQDRMWLALNIFHEARGENLHGKMAIAFVTLNRVTSNHWPDTIKEVVTQPYQFSWYNNKTVPPIKKDELKTYDECKRIADLSIELYNAMAESNDFDSDGLTRGSTHYFADYIKKPRWSSSMSYNAKIGKHLFYTGI